MYFPHGFYTRIIEKVEILFHNYHGILLFEKPFYGMNRQIKYITDYQSIHN